MTFPEPIAKALFFFSFLLAQIRYFMTYNQTTVVAEKSVSLRMSGYY